MVNPPLGLVAMAIESSHRLIMRKWLHCIFSITSEVIWTIFGSYDHLMIIYPVYAFFGQWPFCWLPWQNFKVGVCKSPTGKENPVELVTCRDLECGIGGSGNMQLKYLFSHHFFNYSVKTLRKHAYSNILKMSPPKTENFQIKKLWYFSYFCTKHRLWVLIRTASLRRF